ncbi:MAG: hypothetical protein SFU27_06530 [Thermonemataceae bacterium]|nr:hypothetical protein [Thermonemataceae bacterium]
MLLSSFSAFSQTCEDSLKMAISFGRVLVKDIALKDSLLTIRKQTIQILQAEVISLSREKKSLVEDLRNLQKRYKTIRARKNILTAISCILIAVLVF